LGYKTGETPLANKNLVTIFENKKGDIFISVVLDSDDHFADTKIIMKSILE
jgi:D-alanyl-D-alanine carboxypeptidase